MDCSDVYVGCSGNFTVEKAIYPLKKFNVYSNDVTLYSLCLGAYLSGQTFELVLSEEGFKKIPWLEKYLNTPEDRLASIMLLSGIVRYMDKDNAYYSKMYSEYVRQFKNLHATTVERIAKNEMHVKSYFSGDAMHFVKSAPKNAGFISYPPFKNAGKAFVKDFAKLTRCEG